MARPSRFRRFEQESYDPEVGCKDFMLGALLVMCVALMGTGVWFMVDSPVSGAKRADNIAPYVDAVRYWTDVERDVFSGLSVKVDIPGRGAADLEANTDEVLVSAAESHHRDLPTYEALRYTTLLPATDESAAPEKMSIDPVTEDAYHVNVTLTLVDGGVASELRIQDVPLLKYGYSHDNAKMCRNHQGEMNALTGNRCRFVYEASNICVKVSKAAEGGGWVLDTDYWGHAGCFAKGGYLSPIMHASGAVAYTRTTVRAYELSKGVRALAVGVQDNADPHIVAAHVTGGSMTFGSTAKEVSTEGIVMLVLAAVTCVPAAMHFYDRWSARTRRSPYLRHDDDDIELSGGYES